MILRENFLNSGTKVLPEGENVFCGIVSVHANYVSFTKYERIEGEKITLYKQLRFPRPSAADITLQDIENRRTNALLVLVTEPRIVTLSGESSRILFKESIAYNVVISVEEGTQIQYILISAGSSYEIKRLTLRKCTLNAVQCMKGKSRFVFKIDHVEKDKVIVFFQSASEVPNEIGYTIADILQPCAAENLLAKNSVELNQNDIAALVEAINEIAELYCAIDLSASIRDLGDDSCPEVPKTAVTTVISNKTVAIFPSNLKSKICYAIEVGNFL